MGLLPPLLAVIGAGFLWTHFSPGGVDGATLRRALNALMVYLLVPALVFDVMLRAPMDTHLLWVILAGWTTIAVGAVLAIAMNAVLAKRTSLPAPTRGALVLAAIFGNGLGAALPVVHQLFDGRQDQVPLGFDLLATIPVSWTLGAYVAIRFGSGSQVDPVRQILRLPPIWAVAVALPLNLAGVRLTPEWKALLEPLVHTAIALMPLTLGLALDFRPRLSWKWIAAPIVIRFAGGLAMGLAVAAAAGMAGEEREALLWVCAAPPFMMGVVFCDRFGLDTGAFALAMSLGVAVYLLVLVALAA